MSDILRCPLCSSGNPEHFLECEDHFLTHEKFNLAKCPACGFLFTKDPPSETAIQSYYESADYISHDDKATGLVNAIYRVVRSVMLGRKRNLVKKLTQLNNGSVLDIGSGTGYFLSEMKRSGWKVKGIEINPKARHFSVESLGLDVISPDAIDSLPESEFDCITLWHVLEHFHDPDGYVREVRRMLKPSGICIIALPNSHSPDAKHYGNFWAAYDVPRHLWHFSPSTFRKFSEKNGFDLLGIKRMPADVFYISSVSEKYKGTRLSFFTGLLKGVWFSIRTLFNREGSSSLIYILTKKLDF